MVTQVYSALQHQQFNPSAANKHRLIKVAVPNLINEYLAQSWSRSLGSQPASDL